MTDYSMSDELFLKRAGEEGGYMISAVGAGLVRAMSSVAVNVSLNEAQQRFVQGKILAGQFRSVNDLFQEALRVLQSHDSIKTVQLRELRVRISDSISAFEPVEQVDGRQFVENLISSLQNSEPRQKAG